MRFVNGSTNTDPTPEVEVKVVLLGHYFCGKTSLLERFLTDRFIGENRYQNTIGASYGAKKVTLNDKQPLLLGVWDTAGSERYESMSRMYYRAAKAAVVCYDVTDEESWNKAKFWVDELKRNEDSCKIYIVGTKLDLLVMMSLEKTRVSVEYRTRIFFIRLKIWPSNKLFFIF